MLVIAIEGVSGIGKTTLLTHNSGKFKLLFKDISGIYIESYRIVKLSKIYGKGNINRINITDDETRVIKFLELFKDRITQVEDVLSCSNDEIMIFDRIGLQSLYLALLYARWNSDKQYAIRKVKKIYTIYFDKDIRNDIEKLFTFIDYLLILSYDEGKEKLKQKLKQDRDFILKHKDINWNFFDILYDMYINTEQILKDFGISMINTSIHTILVSHKNSRYCYKLSR